MRDLFLQSQYDFAAPLIFGFILFLAFWIGFMNGFRISIFFLILNIIAWSATIIVIKTSEIKIIDFTLGKLKSINSEIPKIFKEHESLIKPIFKYALTLVSLIAFNFIFFILFWFFRRKLKHKIKFNKECDISNKWLRLSGGLVAIITAVPFAALLSVPFTLIGNLNNFETFISKLLKIMSFNIIESITQNAQQLIDKLLELKK